MADMPEGFDFEALLEPIPGDAPPDGAVVLCPGTALEVRP